MPLSEAKNQSNAVLERAVRGIAELITKPGEINLDFADVKSVMANAGSTMMGSGIGEGVDRAEDAILQAIASPLLEDVDVKDAKGLLINITSNGSLTNGELRSIGDHIGSLVDEEEAEVILGTTIDESLENKLKVTVVATGMSNSNTIKEDMENKVDIVIDSQINSQAIAEMQLKEKKETSYKNNQEREENKYDDVDHVLRNYAKQDEYKINEEVEEKKDSKMKKQNNIQHKTNSNGELDLDFLDIPAFLRKQAD